MRDDPRSTQAAVQEPPPPLASGYDPKLTSKEFAQTISALGIRKANTKAWQLFVLGLLAGLYISMGGHVFLVALEQGAGRIVAGAVFSVGLVLVVVAGAELFTGNVIMIVGAITGHFPVAKLARNWVAVYLANFVGAYLFAMAIWHSGLLGHAGALNPLGELAGRVSAAKIDIPFTEAFIRGILCNMLVVLAIIMATMSKDIISKIACCVFPIMTFVACGFEHCVANMYLIPVGLFAQGVPAAGQGAMWANLIPVTLGNVVGGILILIIHPNRIRQIAYLIERRKHLSGS